MEDGRKRSPAEESELSTSAVKRQREEGAEYEVGEDIMAWLSMDEYYEEAEDDRLIVELLEAEEKSCAVEAANKVRFTENPYQSSPASVFQTTPSSYVTINGNEESCGSSFSDWDSSVMASVDMAGFPSAVPVGPDVLGTGFEAALGSSFEAGMDGAWVGREGCGEWEGLDLDLDDDSLAGFLGEIFSEQALV